MKIKLNAFILSICSTLLDSAKVCIEFYIFRRTMSMNSDTGEEGQKTLSFCSLDESGSGSKKSLFRKKTRKVIFKIRHSSGLLHRVFFIFYSASTDECTRSC